MIDRQAFFLAIAKPHFIYLPLVEASCICKKPRNAYNPWNGKACDEQRYSLIGSMQCTQLIMRITLPPSTAAHAFTNQHSRLNQSFVMGRGKGGKRRGMVENALLRLDHLPVFVELSIASRRG